MAGTGVTHIELHDLRSTRAFGFFFRPSEVIFEVRLAIPRNLFYKTETRFLQKRIQFPSRDQPENFCVTKNLQDGLSLCKCDFKTRGEQLYTYPTE